MKLDVIMPKLGLTMEEGTLVRWFKKAGDPVRAGEVIFEVETDKSIQEVESPGDGYLTEILVEEGVTVPVAVPVARISRDPLHLSVNDRPPQAAAQGINILPPSQKDTAPLRAIHTEGDSYDNQTRPINPGRRLVSWRAKWAASQSGIDLESIGSGSGPGGRIIERDVLEANSRLKNDGSEEWIELTHLQRVTAERMVQSFSKVPHFYLTVEVNAEHLLKFRDDQLPDVQTAFGVRLSISDILVKMAAQALENHPRANASWVEGKLRVNGAVHIGLATATPLGLLVPVIHHANQKSLGEIAGIRSQLTTKAHQVGLQPDEMSGGSFTLTNLGMYGIDQFQAIINPPQSVILSVGRIKERPVGENGQVVLKPVFYLTLSCDHRVLDGAAGAAFLQEMVGIIENPAILDSTHTRLIPG